MPEVDGITGLGAKFMRFDGTDFAEIASVFNLAGPGLSRDSVEITTLDSPGGWRQKIGGLRDGGQVTFSLNFRRSTFLIFKGDYNDDNPVQYQIILPDDAATTLIFSGLVTEMPFTIPEGDRVTVDVTIEISGEVTDDLQT